MQTRRTFLKTAVLGAPAMVLAQSKPAKSNPVPSYLSGYAELYDRNPRAAALQWFREAKFGLFLHYGLYSIPARHEWLQFRETIPVAEYAKFKNQFTAEKFDADFITELALAAQMRYVNITTRHHDSFCLFASRQTDFNSANSPAGRDLIGELAHACAKKGLGLCLYYSHGRDWRHPDAPNNDGWGGSARPNYSEPEPAYHYGGDHDLSRYLEFMKAQITELLTRYGPIGAIWLDGIAVPMHPKGKNNKEMFRCQELYDHIHSLQPQVLVSYKQGLLGTEDFFAPEHKAVDNLRGAPMEICTTLQQGSWGYKKNARWLTPEAALERLSEADRAPANLLLNVGPKGDGSIPARAVEVLREVGRRIRNKDRL